MIASLPKFLTHLGATNDPDGMLSQMLAAADAAVKRYLRRDIEQANYTEFYSGTGKQDIKLRQRPAVTTGLSVYLDQNGFWGQGSGAFASDKLLTAGTDYALILDKGSSSECGLIRRLGLQSLSGISGGIYYPSGIRAGTLTGWDRGAIWPPGDGNIKVIYTAGYTAATMPGDLIEAVCMLAAQLKAAKDQGHPLQQESFIDYSYTLMQSSKAPFLSEVRSLLAPYREILVA